MEKRIFAFLNLIAAAYNVYMYCENKGSHFAGLAVFCFGASLILTMENKK